jgi:predicted nucleotidyltransferase
MTAEDAGGPDDLPTFIISVGTQVVLKAAKRVPGTDTVHPVGSVAEVLEAPANNRRPYRVRFVDGSTVRATFGELAVRRREVAEELATPGADLRRYVIYRVAAGSRAFGLATEASDEDRRAVYLPPAEMTWSLFKPPEQLEYRSTGDVEPGARGGAPGYPIAPLRGSEPPGLGPEGASYDSPGHRPGHTRPTEEVCWELEKFLHLALQANPNILETLWSPTVLYADANGRALRELRTAFLSRHLYKTYSGYVLSQFRLMQRGFEKKGTYKTKHAMHLIRLLYSGLHALRTGEILVDVGEHREELLRIRGGALAFEEVRQRALELTREFQAAFATTGLPERPDYERVNRFLVQARRSMVEDRRRG